MFNDCLGYGFSGQFFGIFEINFFALFLLYLTWCTMWRLYMAFVSSKQHLEIFSENMRDACETANCKFHSQMLFAVKGGEL